MRFLSKIEQVAAYLREDVARGKWHHQVPGRDELAGELGVNAKTVEHALRLLEKEGLLVSQGAGRRRLIATNHKDKTSLNIRILLYDDQDHAMINSRDLIHRMTVAGHNATNVEKTQMDLGMDPRRVAAYAASIHTDAWIVVAGTRDILASLSVHSTPVLAVFGQPDDLPVSTVRVDKITPMKVAVGKLIASGHRRIVLLCRAERRKHGLTRFEQAFLDELHAHGITTGSYNLPEWVSTISDYHRCLDSLFGKTPPTALLIDEPVHFLAAQMFFSRRGIAVPRDLSLICLDADQTFVWCEPMISHISWDTRPVASSVVKWANRIAAGKHEVSRSVIRAKFVEGGTIGPAPK